MDDWDRRSGRSRGHAADEAAAQLLRDRLRAAGHLPLDADDRISPLLDAGETVVAVRRAVELDRRNPCPGSPAGLAGDLYVTTRRILHLGRGVLAYPLDDIREAIVVDKRLLLVVGDDLGVGLRLEDPMLLRVEIAAARAALGRR